MIHGELLTTYYNYNYSQEELDEVDRQREKVIKSGIVKMPEIESDGEDVSFM